MMREWARRAAALHRELGELADLGPDPRWWLLAGGAAIAWPSRADGEPTAARYVASDAEPAADTFIGYAEPAPHEVIAHAVARAYAARSALRALDGQLPEQPLAVTLQRGPDGAVRVPSELDVAAFAIGTGCWCAPLGADDDREHAARIVRDLWWVLGEIVNARMVAEMRDAGITVPERALAPTVRVLRPLGALAMPFVTITIGDEPIATARHGHRRAWLTDPPSAPGNGAMPAHGDAGPWLGLSSTYDERATRLATVSTCHFAVDGFGHALLATAIADRTADIRARLIDRPRDRPRDRNAASPPSRSTAPEPSDLDAATRDRLVADVRRVAQETARAPDSVRGSAPDNVRASASDVRPDSVRTSASDVRPDNVRGSAPDNVRSFASDARPDSVRTSASDVRPDSVRTSGSPTARLQVPRPSDVAGGAPLGIAWRELGAPVPRAIELAYALGIVLHRAAGDPNARFSPTVQIPVAPGARDDDSRRSRRVVPAIASVRFERGTAEPFESFATRTREALAREADGTGLTARMLAAMKAIPAPVAWKRRAIGPARSRWFESLADLIGGRGCVSRIQLRDHATLATDNRRAMCAVSSPAQVASRTDALGGCVVTVIDHDGVAGITLCGSGVASSHADAARLLDELLEVAARVGLRTSSARP